MIAVDANGADQGPAAVAEGVARSGLPVLLFGPRAEIEGAAGPHAEIVDAPETIKAGEEAVAAVRSKRDASIVQAAAAVGAGRADALVSAGSTGPTLAAATLAIKRIKGMTLVGPAWAKAPVTAPGSVAATNKSHLRKQHEQN